MRILAFLTVFMISSMAAQAADEPRVLSLLLNYLATDASVQPATEPFGQFIEQLERKRGGLKNDRDFVHHLFYKTHQKFLKTFETDASFSIMLAHGRYNCLTGTALYSLLLHHFGIVHSVIETNYHIFIIAEVGEQSVLLEATDPLLGFTEGERAVEERLLTYKNYTPQPITAGKDETVHYQFQFSLWNSVSTDDLIGLLYFNQAVKAFNEQQLEKSVQYLSKAAVYGISERVNEFSSLIKLAITTSNLPKNVQEELITELRETRKRANGQLTASVSH